MDIEQNKDTGFLVVENGDMSLLTGKEAIGQDIYRSLRTWKREYFRDQKIGIDYINQVTRKGISESVLLSIFRNEILAVPGVLSLSGIKLTIDKTTRTMSLQIDKITSSDGVFPFTIEVGA